jgi:hypothetical protein
MLDGTQNSNFSASHRLLAPAVQSSLLVVLLALLTTTGVVAQQTIPHQSNSRNDWAWGVPADGLRVGVRLDKRDFDIGEDVAVHIAVENLSGTVPVYGSPFVPRPAFGTSPLVGLRVDVLDSDGPLRAVPPGSAAISTFGGPPACPSALPLGNPWTAEKTLKNLGLLPNKQGDYKIVVRWTAYTSKGASCSTLPSDTDSANIDESELMRPYATVTSAPIYIHVANNDRQTGSPAETIPEYTAWKRDFALVDTSFGEKTALLDKSTCLEWLHLNFTANRSYEHMMKETQPGGEFEGWQIATLAQVRTFFAGFTGTPDGSSSDPSIERKLQRLLGGPIDEAFDKPTHWHRNSIYAWMDGPTSPDNNMIHRPLATILEDTGPEAEISIESGSAVPNFASQSYATFLVRSATSCHAPAPPKRARQRN